MLTLYGMSTPNVQKVLIMLEETGLPYEEVLLDYGTTMKAPEYLAINPMGKVPTIRHNGAIVAETVAIFIYLADAFPQARLAPSIGDPDRVRVFDAFIDELVAKGGKYYADFGMGRSRGTIPIQIAGNVKHGGLFEAAFGMTLGEIVEEIGGGTASGAPLPLLGGTVIGQAVLAGGGYLLYRRRKSKAAKGDK